MKRIILLGLLYFGLFGFNSIKSISWDGVVKVGGGLCSTVSFLELYNAYRCYKRYMNIPSTSGTIPLTPSERLLASSREYDQFESLVNHLQTAFFTTVLTCVAFHKEIKNYLGK